MQGTTTMEEDNAGAPTGLEAGDDSGSTNANPESHRAGSNTLNASGSGMSGGSGGSAGSGSTGGSQIESQGQTSGTSVNKAQRVEQTGTSKGSKSLKGYSAPDGTAAENRDGDQYTKHDTTRMPSGSVPIK
jgi:hypothetical protein